MPNIEMKARYANLGQARDTAIKLGGKLLWRDEQIDTYFRTRFGKLKLRESGLNCAELLPYVKTDQDGLKRSDYAKIPISDPSAVKNLLEKLMGISLVVHKTREVYLIDNVRVHLDDVKGLGTFLEFEAVFNVDTKETCAAETDKVANLMRAFNVGPSDLLSGSYPELLEGERLI